jgi:hypothetical protein
MVEVISFNTDTKYYWQKALPKLVLFDGNRRRKHSCCISGRQKERGVWLSCQKLNHFCHGINFFDDQQTNLVVKEHSFVTEECSLVIELSFLEKNQGSSVA